MSAKQKRKEFPQQTLGKEDFFSRFMDTAAVHAGERGRARQNRSVTVPLEQTAAYYFGNTEQIIKFYKGELEGIKYGRYGNPTQHAVEEKMAGLERTERSLLFSSGMNALATTVLALAGKGEHIIFASDCYRNTKKFFAEIAPRFGMETTEAPMDDIGNLGSYAKNNTRIFFSEMPTNPFLRVIDLEFAVSFARKHGLTSIIDATFATPINIRPAEFGADLVLHSATKYLGGHHDLFAGIAAGKSELIEKIQHYRDLLGGIIDPHTSFLLLRSLQTLQIRMEAHNSRALKIARYLEKHPLVEKVWYPGCDSHPDYKLAKKQMDGFGGVITFTLKASEKETSYFIDALKIPYIASNFGGPQSLIEQHAVLTFYNDRIEAEKRGICGNLLRYSVGFENPKDVMGDFEGAFKAVTKKRP
ncbi:Cys/Met metabolism PLP-dependent enzyme [uncultured archaeon]|nr:Cys/Met metabolism PLP-dependent enzyme [uncultured archaeon]